MCICIIPSPCTEFCVKCTYIINLYIYIMPTLSLHARVIQYILFIYIGMSIMHRMLRSHSPLRGFRERVREIRLRVENNNILLCIIHVYRPIVGGSKICLVVVVAVDVVDTSLTAKFRNKSLA